MNRIVARSLSWIGLGGARPGTAVCIGLSATESYQPAAEGLGSTEAPRDCSGKRDGIGDRQPAVDIERMKSNWPAVEPPYLGLGIAFDDDLGGIEAKPRLLSLPLQPREAGAADRIEPRCRSLAFGHGLIACMTTSSLRTRKPLPPGCASAVLRRTTGFRNRNENRRRQPVVRLGEKGFGGSISNSWCTSTGKRAERR